MRKHIKLPDLDYTRMENAVKIVAKFIGDHPNTILVGTSVILLIDDIRGRYGRKKDRLGFEQSTLNTQKILCKQEAKIVALAEQAEQGQEAKKKVDLLEQVVQNIVKQE